MNSEYRPDDRPQEDPYACYYVTGAPPRRRGSGCLIAALAAALLLALGAML